MQADEFKSGTLAPPFSSSTVAFSTLTGLVEAEVTWAGTSLLDVTLACGTRSTSRAAGSGIEVTLHAMEGVCSLTVSTSSVTTVTYELALTREVPVG